MTTRKRKGRGHIRRRRLSARWDRSRKNRARKFSASMPLRCSSSMSNCCCGVAPNGSPRIKENAALPRYRGSAACDARLLYALEGEHRNLAGGLFRIVIELRHHLGLLREEAVALGALDLGRLGLELLRA